MPTDSESTKLIYWIIAGPIAVVAAWFILRGLFHDRARGRLRCPKCWYDMSGGAAASSAPDATRAITLPITCPECGRVVRKMWQLRKTRVGLRITAVGTLLLIACIYGNQVRHRVDVLNEPVTVALVPTTYWIVVAPSSKAEVLRRVAARAGRDIDSYFWRGSDDDVDLWFWQKELLARSCQAILLNEESDAPEEAITLQAILARTNDTALASVIESINHANDVVVGVSVEFARRNGERSWRARPALIGLMKKHNEKEATQAVVNVLGELGPRQFEGMTDQDLCAVIDGSVGHSERPSSHRALHLYLAEAVRRRSPACVACVKRWVTPIEGESKAELRQNLSNLELRTAMARLEGSPDPLTIVLKDPQRAQSLRVAANNPGTLAVNIEYVGEQEHQILLDETRPGAGRHMRFRLQVHDAAGRLMPIKTMMPTYASTETRNADGYFAKLKIADYLQSLPPGKYRLVIQYCNTLNISNMTDISNAIVIESKPIELIVE